MISGLYGHKFLTGNEGVNQGLSNSKRKRAANRTKLPVLGGTDFHNIVHVILHRQLAVNRARFVGARVLPPSLVHPNPPSLY